MISKREDEKIEKGVLSVSNSKKISLFSLVSLGVGSVIGSGIFSMLCMGMSMTGRSIVLSMVLAMFLAILQQVRNLFISSMFAMDGGVYAQQALVLPPDFTGIMSIVYIISNCSFTVLGISVASYIIQLIPALAPYRILISVVILSVFFLLSIRGTSALAKVQNVMTVCMYVALGMLIVFGIMNGQDAASEDGTPYFAYGANSFMMSVALMSFTCNGTTCILNVTADAKNPKRNVPLAIILSGIICAVIYALLAYVASLVLPISEAANYNLGTVAQKIMPNAFYIFFLIGGAIGALLTSLLGGIAGMWAPIASGAEDGWLPKFLAKKNRYGTAPNVLILMWIIAIVPVIFDFSLDTIVSFITAPGAFVNVVAVALSFRLPQRFPEAWKKCGMHCPYWLYCFLLAISGIASLLIGIYSLMMLDTVGIIGNIALTLAMFLYAHFRYKSGKVHLYSIEGVADTQ